MSEFNVSGTYIWYYCICKREVWLLAHGIEADQQDENMQMGSVIHETAYGRESKEIEFKHSKFDVMSKENGKLIVGEIKKSSRYIDSSRMQLLFYLKELEDNDIVAEGVLLFPEEKKRESIVLDSENRKRLEAIIEGIKGIVAEEYPPAPLQNKYCKKCAYGEFCWA
ncbi:MAG: CRISPR-associated protein Cas4 [Firmicutes bacterium HGW-Firmicutes-7]|nr:MAG: CRISPR-associated protein Cas4 [Firmicutes bacterium HGW-Firmicutes-7]